MKKPMLAMLVAAMAALGAPSAQAGGVDGRSMAAPAPWATLDAAFDLAVEARDPFYAPLASFGDLSGGGARRHSPLEPPRRRVLLD